MKRLAVYLILAITAAACAPAVRTPAVRQPGWAQKVEARNFSNLYKVDEQLYRCEQPSRAGLAELQQLGIKTVLNLRRCKADPRPANLPLRRAHVRINTWTIGYDDVLKALIEIEKAEKPVAVHCKHGSDRTGCVVAAWLLVKHDYPKDKVIEEMRHGGYHFHERYFKNIIRLIESLDVSRLKEDLRKWEEKAPVKNS